MEIFTEEIKQFIAENYTKLMKPEMLEEIKSRFGADELTAGKLKYYYTKNGLKGIDCRGRLAGWNKGVSITPEHYAKAQKTMFKKGQPSTRRKPVGSERIHSQSGYIVVKVAEPNVWRLKQRVLYEQYHNVTLSKHDIVTFLDRNPLNFDIDNLVLLSRSTLRIMNQKLSFGNGNPEITQALINLAKSIEITEKAKLKLKNKE